MIKNPGTNLVIYNNDKTSDLIAGTLSGEVHIASGTTRIRNYGLVNLPSITAVTIPKTVIAIGNYAFYGDTNLATITVEPGANITTLGEYCFQGIACKDLSEVVKNTTNIPAGCFYSVPNQNRPLVFNNAIISVGSYAFRYFATSAESWFIFRQNVAGGGGYWFEYSYDSKKNIWLKANTSWNPSNIALAGGKYKIRADQLTSFAPAGSNMLLPGIFVFRANSMCNLTGSIPNLTAACNVYVPESLISTYKANTKYASAYVGPCVAEVSDLDNIDTNTYTKAYVCNDSIIDDYDTKAIGRQYFFIDGAWVEQSQ